MRRLIFVLAIAACGHPPKHDHGTPTPAHEDDPTCPVLVAGTSVTVEDTDHGAAFVFVTTGDERAVRVRADALARMHNDHQGKPEARAAGGPEFGAAAMAPPMHHAMAMGTMIGVPSKAEVSELPKGARVTFTANRDEDVAKLQSELRMHAQHLAGGTCEM